jgi:hypothetical protein
VLVRGVHVVVKVVPEKVGLLTLRTREEEEIEF